MVLKVMITNLMALTFNNTIIMPWLKIRSRTSWKAINLSIVILMAFNLIANVFNVHEYLAVSLLGHAI